MSFAPPDGPLPELTTTRVASGASARLVAAAVAGLLIGVVGYAFVNRPSAQVPVPVAVEPSGASSALQPATPAASPPRNQIQGNDGIFGWRVGAQLGQQSVPREYRYEASMTVVGGLVRVPLEPSSLVDVHNGTVVLGAADVGSTLTLGISRNWTKDGLLIFEPFDAWTIGLKPLRKSRGLVELLVAHVPPALAGPNGPEPVATGYTFTVLGRRVGTELTLYLELVWPLATQPSESIANVGPRDPALYNRCRWDIGPLSAPPRPGTNEADC